MSTTKKPKTTSAITRKPKDDLVRVRRIHRRDLNRVWEFLKLVFRSVNKNTLEYQRPRTKSRFFEVYDVEDTDQLLFEHSDKIVGYAECSYSPAGADNWMNPRYFDKRGMRPLFVDELAVHPDYQGRGVGSFMMEQLQHIARTHGCTHLVLEVAQNNKDALRWYHKRNFYRLDAAIFLAQKVPVEPELLPPRLIKRNAPRSADSSAGEQAAPVAAKVARAPNAKKAVKRAGQRAKKPEPKVTVATT